jgi:hypothetical protein
VAVVRPAGRTTVPIRLHEPFRERDVPDALIDTQARQPGRQT